MNNYVHSFLMIMAVIIWSFCARANDSKTKAVAMEMSKQIIVHLRDPVGAKKFLSSLPKEMELYASLDDLFIIKTRLPATKDDVVKLKKLPGVLSAELDRPVFAKNPVASGSTDCREANMTVLPQKTQIEKLGNEIAKKVILPLEIKGAKDCDVFETCPNYKIEKFWAQERVDADLMKDYIEKNKLRGANIRSFVSVVDTGFDKNRLIGMVKGDSIKILPGVFDQKGKSQVGNPVLDENGHGTMVASTIGGANGMGVAPNSELSVYKVTAADSNTTSSGFLEYSVRRACLDAKKADPKSTPVINESWGSRDDEMGANRSEKNTAFMDFLKNNGCILVKAAGNDNFIRDDKYVKEDTIDHPLIRVAATDGMGARASFSSSGKINAPGQDVYVLASSVQKNKVSNNKACEIVKEGDSVEKVFINGTSLAAPIAAGLASEVVGVLRSKQDFDKLPPEKRIALVNRILSASTMSGTINGLRAVVIAQKWSDIPTIKGALPSVSELSDWLNNNSPAFCSEKNNTCESSIELTCNETKKCLSDLRAAAALCRQPQQRNIEALIDFSSQKGSSETAAKYLKVLSELKVLPSDIALVASRLTTRKARQAEKNNPSEYFRTSFEFGNGFMSEIFPYYLNSIPAGSDDKTTADARKILEDYLNSDDFMSMMNNGPGRGSEATIASILETLEKLGKILGEAKLNELLIKFVSTKIMDFKEYGSANSEDKGLLSIIRLTNAIRSDTRFKYLVPKMAELDKDIFDALDKYHNLNPPKKDSSCAWFSCIFGEQRATHVYYENFLKENTDKLVSQLNKADFSVLSSVKSS